MKPKQILLYLLTSIGLMLLVAPLGAVGHEFKFFGASSLYFIVTLFFLNRASFIEEKIFIISIMALPPLLLYGFIHSTVDGTALSIPSTIAHPLGIFFALLVNITSKNFKIILTILLLLITTWMTVFGYRIWMSKLAYGSFSGNTHETAPDYSFIRENGTRLTNNSLEDKIVVLDFWNIHCGSCLKRFPLLQETYNNYKSDPEVLVYSVNVLLNKDTQEQALKILKNGEFSFPTLFTTEAETFGIKGFPTAIILKGSTLVYRGDIEGVDKKIKQLKNL